MMDNEILQLAALVAAFVGVLKGLGLKDKYAPLAATAIAAVFVLVPDSIQAQITIISIVGLTASGAYQHIKKKGDEKNDKLGL